jgi:SAM-dependent methyltransferase
MGIRRRVRRAIVSAREHLSGKVTRGYCPICETRTVFVREDSWLREHYCCRNCRSIPRQRALIKVLNDHFRNWKSLRVHESSPGGASSDKIRLECPGLVQSQFFANVPRGQYWNGQRSEDLECLTFDNSAFDLTITQDVFEHILQPERAFAEIARTLEDGGAHVFTVPYFRGRKTLKRVRLDADGSLEYPLEPEYHGNPIDEKGSLVITEWGDEICDFIFRTSGMTTTVYSFFDTRFGLEGEFLDVFVSRKSQIS